MTEAYTFLCRLFLLVYAFNLLSFAYDVHWLRTGWWSTLKYWLGLSNKYENTANKAKQYANDASATTKDYVQGTQQQSQSIWNKLTSVLSGKKDEAAEAAEEYKLRAQQQAQEAGAQVLQSEHCCCRLCLKR